MRQVPAAPQIHRARFVPGESALVPLVSIIEPNISRRGTDEFDFLSLMIRFKARYIVLFPGMRTLQNSIPFLHVLGYGPHPDWLTLRVRTPRVVIYECGACAK